MWIKVIGVLILIWRLTNAQEGSRCLTPLSDPGLCINIYKCDGLITLLTTQSKNPEVISYLRQSSCGFVGNDPLVCCPQIGQNTNTLPETTETVTTSNTDASEGNEGGSGRSLANYLMKPPHCGFSNVSDSKVVGGIDAKLGQFPWAVELGYRNSEDSTRPKWLCGGSLITERHILTAGHCVYNRPDLYMARIGDLDLYSDDDGAHPEDIPLINAKIHENYSPTTFTNDIAILTLAHKPEQSTVWPICLPLEEKLRSNLFVKYQLFVAGWGSLYFNGPSSTTLQVVQLPVVSNDQCRQSFARFRGTTIDERVLCAGYATGGKDSCKGDSGGPLMLGRLVGDDTVYYQIGVVSYGFRCAEEGYPGVYSRVAHFLDWISNNLN